jgi:hypothetical protein
MKWLTWLAILVILLFPCGAVKFTSGTSSSSDNNRDDTTWVTPSIDDNTYSASEVQKFGEKLITTISEVPDGKPIKVLVIHGNSDEITWEQILNDFRSSDNLFESDADRTAFELENQRFKDNEQTTFSEHMKMCQRLIKFAADQVSLSSDARLSVLLGTIRIQNNAGTEYNLPAIGLISHDRDESGEIVYPSNEADGIVDDDKDLKAPFEPGDSDKFEWYSVTTD